MCFNFPYVSNISTAHDMRLLQVVRMVVSTYQAASGAGAAAMEELVQQTREVSPLSKLLCFEISCWIKPVLNDFNFLYLSMIGP